MAYVLSDRELPQLEIAPEIESLGVFKANREAPFHRWVHLTEGFSARLVAQELSKVPNARRIYDPFGGTRTTPLVAVEMGRTAAWAEVNPYLQEAARIKVAAACADRDERDAVAAVLLGLLSEGPEPKSKDGDHPLAIASARRDFFSADVLGDLLGWVRCFQSASGLARRVGLLAVATSAIQSSNMKRAVDLRRRTARELAQPRMPASDAVRERVWLMINDLLSTPVAPGCAELVSTKPANCRRSSAQSISS